MRRLQLVLLSSLLLAGCSDVEEGASTPKEAFTEAQSAASSESWAEFLACWTEGSRGQLLFAADEAARIAAEKDGSTEELAEIHTEHKVEREPRGSLALTEPGKFMAARFAKVRNKPELLGELMDFLDDHGHEGEVFQLALKDDPAQVDKNLAKATLEGGATLWFTRGKGGRWFLSLTKPRAKPKTDGKTAKKTKTGGN